MDWFISKTGKKKYAISDEQKEIKPYLNKEIYENFSLTQEEIKEMVILPVGMDINEWLATHTLTLFNSINQIYGAITEFCTANTCPTMTAGAITYSWYGRKGKISAPQYIDLVMTHIQKHVEDESCLPSKYGSKFPASFGTSVKKFIKLLLHVLGHIYYSHIEEVSELQLHPYLNTVFIHLMYFDNRFCLLDVKDTAPLEDLALAMNLNL
ncbi:MOB kinase activator 2-like [Xenia sp. Carnegie-2017]|uniref:MOB kinase activator 2-like n=1 Tax=Xenia sp. Carnegie-2017 TaxID=2897299 RepID=UPI001F03EB28|nr:MOB kinase activator 2-like [Xenia sp. Carnegie-2017]